jgi:hypothetical protein
MHDRYKPLARQECRKLLVGDTPFWEGTEHSRCHQHNPHPRVRQTLVDGAHERLAKPNVLLTEPDPDTTRLKKVVQFLGGLLSVVPSMAEEDVSEFRSLGG